MAASNHGSGLQLSNSLNTTINQQQEGQNAIECTNTTKKGRGRTNGLGVAKRKKKSATGKLHVDIPIDKMWKNIPEDIFNKIVSKVLDAFDIDNTTHNREVILFTAKRLYRNHRCRFHQHFSQYKTNAIALEHRPDDVGEDDWKFLLDYFSSPNYKVISERNKLNKAKQVINHRCGRKSFQAVSYDARDPETQKEPNYQDLWRMTHTNSNGKWINDASKEVHTKIQERCSELLELGYMDEDKDKLTNTAFEAVVGVRSGYSRGLGARIKPQKGKNVAGLHEELKKEREKRHGIEKKLKDIETQRQQERIMMEEMTAKIEESQRQFEES
ncbi:hypothetical protein P8452_66650 [Trifolium repens]|nr:hypothetical protein P8452_66650 [Trifolium repens]